VSSIVIQTPVIEKGGSAMIDDDGGGGGGCRVMFARPEARYLNLLPFLLLLLPPRLPTTILQPFLHLLYSHVLTSSNKRAEGEDDVGDDGLQVLPDRRQAPSFRSRKEAGLLL